jgi:GMP synthase (glutamine-hydrolysing)
MSRSAVLYIHEPHVGPGHLGESLRHAGFSLTPRLRETRPEDVEAPLLVVMGGSMGVYEADQHPFLHDELRVIRARLEAGLPTVGVCLGSQLLAAAAGSRVYRGSAGMEVGVHPVTWNGAALKDPVLGAVAAECADGLMPVTQWHGDTFDAVPGATLLASSPRYAWQAFRVGSSYGFQFHPELDESMFLEWTRVFGKDAGRAGLTVEQLQGEHLTRFRAAHPGMKRLCDAVARHFAGELTRRAA